MSAFPTSESVEEIRTMSPVELQRLGQDCLRSHLIAQAGVARVKHGPTSPDGLKSLLQDRDLVRYPVRLVFEFGEMAMHQFAQPEPDWQSADGNGRVLYLRPSLQNDPVRVALATAYMIPVINFGDVVSDDDCLSYGAALLGMDSRDYYEALCNLADQTGAEVLVGESAPR